MSIVNAEYRPDGWTAIWARTSASSVKKDKLGPLNFNDEKNELFLQFDEDYSQPLV